MIDLRDFDEAAALSVFQFLDADDLREAELVRGRDCSRYGLWADWRAMVPAHLLSVVAHKTAAFGSPAFAILALGNTGQSGVAQAALVARDHKKYRRSLAEFALTIRNEMPRFCLERGINRVEARAWADHPRASAFLTAVGFVLEAEMSGFGADGAVTFRQFVWLSPEIQKEASTCA
ncbi:hypothetical protein [Pacificibacter marinus]|uniref:hypothetical protein n=1 Tax=Pacificibacter marinus TaxID=658057 RepID=UPI001C07E1C4|nr:hypothetical protein [Pacificibacter marinus]MBU2867022.1 hypothetical protein [Pacificibacter marinus]